MKRCDTYFPILVDIRMKNLGSELYGRWTERILFWKAVEDPRRERERESVCKMMRRRTQKITVQSITITRHCVGI